MGKVQKQKQTLYNHLKDAGRLNLSQAVRLLNVSESTARRFFGGLESDGLAVRNYGGIQLSVNRTAEFYSFNLEEGQHIEQKKMIAAYAIGLVDDGDTIYIDSGTTLSHFSTMLSERLKSKKLNHVTIVTNSINNINILHNHEGLILIGGEYREYRKDFYGYIAEETIKMLRFKKCFLGCDGYSPAFGFSTTDFYTARLNEIVLGNSEKSYVLMDSSKYKRSSVVSYSKKSGVGTLITDAALPAGAIEIFNNEKTEVFLCGG